MILSEVEFAFFFPVILGLYWILPRRAGWQNLLLLVASYLFYATWNLALLPLFIGSTILDYAVGIHLGREGARHRRLAFAIGVASNLGTLVYFKYAGFFDLPVTIALPLGLSFYTMSRVGYLIDVYTGRVEAERSFLTFATFVAFFPQLIAGPIGRAGTLMPQYAAPRRPEPAMWGRGASALLLGVVLKCLIADNLAIHVVNPVWQDAAAYSAVAHWAALFGYGAQVFADFAGYSLLAIGAGRMLGIELPPNFDWPFLSTSLPEVWRRWHMSLNNWLFDYVYGPLTMGDSFLRGRLDLGFIVVFLLSGVWHGAAGTFVLWGLLHGLGLVVHRRYDVMYRGLCRKDRVWVKRRKSRPYKLAGWVATQLFFFLTLIPFRSASLGDAWSYTKGLFSGGGEPFVRPGMIPMLAIAVLVGLHLLEAFGERVKTAFLALPAPVRGVCYGLVIVFLMLGMPIGAGAFIYAQF